MPGKYPDSNKAKNDESIKKTDESEDRQRSKIHKIRFLVQNFFNHLSPKEVSNEDRNEKNKQAEQNNAVMNRNARNSPHKDRLKCKEIAKPHRNVNCRHRCCNQHVIKEQLSQSVDHPLEKLPLNNNKLEERSKSKTEDQNNNNETNGVGVLSKEDRGKNKAGKSIPVNKRKNAASKLGCSKRHWLRLEMSSEEILTKYGWITETKKIKNASSKTGCPGKQTPEKSGDKVHRRHSEPPVQRFFSRDYVNLRPNNENLSLKWKRLPEENLGSLQMIPSYSGSIILLSENDPNVKFTEYKPDVGIIVHQTSNVESNPALMTGGVVVVDRFVDSFMIPNYFADDPIIFEITDDMHNSELISLEKPPSETFVTEKYFSGGKVTNNSTKGVRFPELFPLKLHTPNGLPFERHPSDGVAVESFSSESETSLDALSNSLTDWGLNSTNFDSDDVFESDFSDSDITTKSADSTQDEKMASVSDVSRLPEIPCRVGRNGRISTSVSNNTFEFVSRYSNRSDSSDKCAHE